jgi:hypothetical protein
MSPKERFPSLYMLLSCTKEKHNISVGEIGWLYAAHVSNLSGDRYLSSIGRTFLDEDANTPTYRERKKQFQNESRIFFNRMCEKKKDTSSLELKSMDRFRGCLNSIEGQIQRLIENYPSDYADKVGQAVLAGARFFQQRTRLSPLGYNCAVFTEYNRILAELSKVR